MLPPIVYIDWDMLANKVYRMFYTPHPTHLDAIIWMRMETTRQSWCHYRRLEPWLIVATSTALTSSPSEYALGGSIYYSLLGRISPAPIVIYKGNTVLLKHIGGFKHQWEITANNDVILLKQFSLSLGGIPFGWYYTLHGIVIPTWSTMKK